MLPAVDAYVDEDRSLNEVGPLAVLEAMVEQRKRFASVPATCELDGSLNSDDDEIATQRRDRLEPGDDVFQKIR